MKATPDRQTFRALLHVSCVVFSLMFLSAVAVAQVALPLVVEDHSSWSTGALTAGFSATMIAHLSENGLIPPRASVNTRVKYGNAQSTWDIVQTYSDGTRFWRTQLSFSGDLPEGFREVNTPDRAGSTFMDGATSPELTAEDFDANGTTCIASRRLLGWTIPRATAFLSMTRIRLVGRTTFNRKIKEKPQIAL
jgi:hypothetical protein